MNNRIHNRQPNNTVKDIGIVCKLIGQLADMSQSIDEARGLLSTPANDPDCDIANTLAHAIGDLDYTRISLMAVLDLVSKR